MGWDTIETRIAGKTRKPAAVRLVVRTDDGRPACVVSFRKPFADGLDWKAGEAVGMMVGTGEHEGLLRVTRLKKGAPHEIAKIRGMNKGGMNFDFGHLPQLGLEAKEKVSTDARIVDTDTIEVTLPDWDSVEAEDVDEDGGQEEVAQQPERRPTEPTRTQSTPSPVPPKKVNGSPALARLGATLDLRHDEESITFRKKTMDLTTRQAAIVAALLRAAPSYIGRKWLIDNVLGDMPAHAREAQLDMIAAELSKALAGIGIELKNTKGVGFALAMGGA